MTSLDTMEFETTVELTPRLFRVAALRHWVGFCGRDFVVSVAATIGAATAWTVLGWRHWFLAAVGGIALFGLSATGTVLVFYLLRARRRLRQMQDPREQWRFTSDGLSRSSEFGEIAAGWASVQRLWRYPDVWILFLGGEDYSALPRAALSPMMEAFITRQVQMHGGAVR